MRLFTGRGLPPIPHYAAVGGVPCEEISVALFIAKLSALPKRLAVFAVHICPRQSNIPQHLIIERGQMPTSACQFTPIEDRLDRPAHKPASRHRRGQAPFKCFGCSRCHDRSPVSDWHGALTELSHCSAAPWPSGLPGMCIRPISKQRNLCFSRFRRRRVTGGMSKINLVASATIETYPPLAEVTQKHAQ